MATATWVRRMHLLSNFKRFRLSDGNVHLFTGVNALSTNATHFHRTGTLSHRTSYGFTLFGFKTINPKFFQLKWPVRNITNQLHGRYKKLQDSSVVCGRYFHTSEARRAAPILPVIGAALAKFSGPIAKSLKLLAVLGGRY